MEHLTSKSTLLYFLLYGTSHDALFVLDMASSLPTNRTTTSLMNLQRSGLAISDEILKICDG
eukprot:scaffold3754_cov157-Skeletonema_marinoi.AAC.2